VHAGRARSIRPQRPSGVAFRRSGKRRLQGFEFWRPRQNSTTACTRGVRRSRPRTCRAGCGSCQQLAGDRTMWRNASWPARGVFVTGSGRKSAPIRSAGPERSSALAGGRRQSARSRGACCGVRYERSAHEFDRHPVGVEPGSAGASGGFLIAVLMSAAKATKTMIAARATTVGVDHASWSRKPATSEATNTSDEDVRCSTSSILRS
jgi:hypothetical protein